MTTDLASSSAASRRSWGVSVHLPMCASRMNIHQLLKSDVPDENPKGVGFCRGAEHRPRIRIGCGLPGPVFEVSFEYFIILSGRILKGYRRCGLMEYLMSRVISPTVCPIRGDR